MGFTIEDGAGSGRQARVTSEHRVMVEAVSASPEHVANHFSGLAYNILFTITPTGAGDCFLYIKNTDPDYDLVLEGMAIKLAANEYIDIKLGDSGTPAGGSVITPANLNAASGNSADGVFQSGSDITGLTGGTRTIRHYHASSLETKYHNFDADIILPKNTVATFYCQTGTTEIDGYVVAAYMLPYE